jgi:GT2 family glycosyltransferase
MYISIVIPVKNDALRLGNCIASIGAVRLTTPAEVVVADNGSTDRSADVAGAAGARVLSLPDLNVAQLRNTAAAASAGDVIAFVDADHLVGSAWLASIGPALSDPAIGAAGALYLSPPNGTWVQRLYGAMRGTTKGTADAPWLGSGNLIVRRAAFEQINGFDASLEACEDVDLCQRLRAAGWRVVGDERLESVHLGDPPTLGALFRAERWRGRDNLRVSLRGPLGWRDIPSVIFPILMLAAFASIVIGTVMAVSGLMSWWLPALAASIVAIIGLLKAIRLCSRLRSFGLTAFSQACAVSFAYESARAIALVTRAPHHRSRPTTTKPDNVSR